MSNADQLEVFLRLLIALGLGAAVGLEREFRGHEAGLRTSALVCLGAAMFGEASDIFGDSRIAAGVVQGSMQWIRHGETDVNGTWSVD